MPLNARTEVRTELDQQISNSGTVLVSKTGRLEAISGLETTRQAYEQARRNALLLDHPRFYRVAIFGSARLGLDSIESVFVTELAKSLVEELCVDIVTGGGSGIMEAGNLGVQIAKSITTDGAPKNAISIGELITTLPGQKEPNLNLDLDTKHSEFPSRLQGFIDRTNAAYFAIGGIGTNLELAMFMQMKQVNHLEEDYPLIAHPFWRPIIYSLLKHTYDDRFRLGLEPLISDTDFNLVTYSDRIPEIVDLISRSHKTWTTRYNQFVQKLP